MPSGDRTGPRGAGSMTGRGAGPCGGYELPGYMNRGRGQHGRGLRRRGRWHDNRWHGWGWGWGRSRWPDLPRHAAFQDLPFDWPIADSPTKEQELDVLKQEAEFLKLAVDNIEKRIQELDSNGVEP